MKYSWLLLLTASFYSLEGISQARNVKKSEIRPFAKNFKCSDPALAYQFRNLISLYDENSKMAQNASFLSRLAIKEQASDVGGNGEWMYRGVTNRQFNERQILRLIFNDSTAVSESRWFSGKMFSEANISSGDFVSMRGDFQSLPYDKRWSAFKTTFSYVNDEISKLINNESGGVNAFSEHVRIGSRFNATPQAIQFLTPHVSYAESYGEFVLHVKEVVRRGIDVERYNYHNPNWHYSIGSIYRLDRDEYMVPSHIPPWDVQIIKVRNGTGWHKGDYGPPIYYYTKVYEDNNPCNVVGVRIDKPDATNTDQRRVPVGMLLLCEKGSTCESVFDNSLPHNYMNRLKAVIKDNTVNDRQVYFLPYQAYQSADPKVLKTMSISMISGIYNHIDEEILKDKKLWMGIFEDKFFDNYKAARKLIDLHAGIDEMKPMLKKSLRKKISSKDFVLEKFDIIEFLEIAKWLGELNNQTVINSVENFMTKPNDREEVFLNIVKLSTDDSVYMPIANNLKAIYSNLKDKTPAEEIGLLQLDLGHNEYNSALVQAVVKGLETEDDFAGRYWNIITGDDSYKITVFELAMVYLFKNYPAHKLEDSIVTYKQIKPFIDTNPDKHKILGLCIDYAIASSNEAAWKLIDKISGLELPKEREIDTLRSLWGLAKDEPNKLPAATPMSERTNKFRFIASSLRRQIYWKLKAGAEQKDAANGNNEEIKLLKNSFNQFFMEFVSPPAPLLGYAALNAIRKVSDKKDILFVWPKTDPVKINVEGVDYDISKDHLEAILGQSLSVYHLLQLKREYDVSVDEDDSNRVLDLKDSIQKTIKAYKHYLLDPNGIISDINDEFIKSLIHEMFDWNKNDNIVGLALFLAKIEEDNTVRANLKAVADQLHQKFPDMYDEIPSDIKDHRDFFEDIMK